MNRRRNRTRKPEIVFAILAVICIVLIIASAFTGISGQASGISSILLGPMQSGVNTFGGLVSNLSEKKAEIDDLESENEELSNQVDELQNRITSLEQNLADYEDLLALTELNEKYPAYDMTGARVIGKNPGNWYKTFTINKGARDGILTGMNVVSGNGLVGIVTQVGVTSSVVKSIVDDTSSVSAMITKNYGTCMVEGDLTLVNQGLLSVNMISDNTSLVDGDEIVTSYISDKFLPGILIGYISNVQTDDSNLSYHARLTPVVDFQHLSTVMVIRQLKGEQADQTAVSSDVSDQMQETEKKETETTITETQTGEGADQP